MLFSTIATAFLATLAAAAPSQKARRDIEVTLTYWAAADNVFSEVIPANGLLVPVGSDLSFTYISSDAPNDVVCESYGIDGSVTTLYGAAVDVPIGPPQEQLTAKCWYTY